MWSIVGQIADRQRSGQGGGSQAGRGFDGMATRCEIARRPRWYLRATAFAAACLLSAGLMGAPAIEWPSTFYNPQPKDGDVTLPMPCGGAMAFRRIEVESTGPLSDVRVDLGASDDLWGYAENTLRHYMAGSFAADTPSTRYFLIGKYEVSQLQYKAVTEDSCPRPSASLRLPQNEIGWFDAVQFTNELSQWLLANAPDALPREQGEPGFVRLPTEVEWEFAARGGMAVSIADFRERVFPMPGGIERNVWFSGTRSANGKLQLTGLLSPNPLGVHDILGNVDEIVLDAFRLNRLDRLHGQVGGFVVRGGNYFTAEQDIRSSQREEVPHFDRGGPRRSKTTGFRVAVSAPVIVSSNRLEDIQNAWVALGQAKRDVGVSAGAKTRWTGEFLDDPVQELAALSEATADTNLKARLQRLGTIMRATLDANDRQRDNAARASLRMGGVICQQVGQDGTLINDLRRRYDLFCAGGVEEGLFSAEECDKRQEFLGAAETQYIRNLSVYADSLIDVARNFDHEVLTDQTKLLLAELAHSEGGRRLSAFVVTYSSQAARYLHELLVRRDLWAEECRRSFETN